MALVYKQPGLLNCCMCHSCKDTHGSQVLCMQQEICKAPRKWRRRGGVNEIETLEKKKFISLKLQDWSLAMERIHWPGKPGHCHRKALWTALALSPISLAVIHPILLLKHRTILKIIYPSDIQYWAIISTSQSFAVEPKKNVIRICVDEDLLRELHRAEKDLFSFSIVSEWTLWKEDGAALIIKKKKKWKEERKKKRKKGASVVSAADQQRSSREL